MDTRARVGLDINDPTDERAPLPDSSFDYFADVHSDLGTSYYVDFQLVSHGRHIRQKGDLRLPFSCLTASKIRENNRHPSSSIRSENAQFSGKKSKCCKL